MIPNNEKLRLLALQAQKFNKSFIAMDEGGLWYAYDDRPVFRDGEWRAKGDIIYLTPVHEKASEQVYEVSKLLTDEQL